MGADDGGNVGDALVVAGYHAGPIDADDPRLPLVTELAEALAASGSP